MLSTSYLASMSDGLVELYSQLESNIIADMAKRLKRLGKVTDQTLWQAKIFQETGGLQQDINRWLEKYNKKAETQLKELFKEALEKSAAKDVAQLNKAGLSDSQQQILNATVKKVASAGIVSGSKKVKEDAESGFIKMFSSVQRATMTIASSSSNEFVQQANAAYMKVVSGAFDYNTALKQGLIDLANKGVDCVEYTDSGKVIKRHLEGMLRTNIMTGVNQTATRVTLDNCKDLDCELVEVSAHMGARPDHEAWQGKIYSLNPDNKKYPYFYTVCDYGSPTGICGINCRHSFYPYFEGVEPMYSNGELDEYKDSTVTYKYTDKKGVEHEKTITQYEGEQKQRFMEREIRKYKRQVAALQVDDPQSPECLAARNKLYNAQKELKKFTDETGLRRDYAREFIATKDGTQPRGIKPITLGGKGNYFENTNEEINRFQQHSLWTFNKDKEYISNVKKGEEMSFQQANTKNVNPLFRKNKNGGYENNCVACNAVFYARMSGWDVEALPYIPHTIMQDIAENQTLLWINKNTGKHPEYINGIKANTIDRVIKFIENTIQKGQKYLFEFKWKDDIDGHTLSIFRDLSGNINIYDGQFGHKYYDLDEFSILLNIVNKGITNDSCVKLLRIDDCNFNKSIVDYVMTKKENYGR